MASLKGYTQKVLVASLLIWLAGCGGGTGTGGSFGSAETLTFEGWDSYKGQDPDKAVELFNNALSLDPTFSDAYNGLGWLAFEKAGQADTEPARARLLNEAKESFERATAADPENVDAWVGLAGLELARDNWAAARDAANRALSLEPRYFSSHDNIDFRNVHLVLAESYFFLGEFVETEETPDPNNALYHLDAVDPGYRKFYQENGLTAPDLVRKIGELQIP